MQKHLFIHSVIMSNMLSTFPTNYNQLIAYWHANDASNGPNKWCLHSQLNNTEESLNGQMNRSFDVNVNCVPAIEQKSIAFGQHRDVIRWSHFGILFHFNARPISVNISKSPPIQRSIRALFHYHACEHDLFTQPRIINIILTDKNRSWFEEMALSNGKTVLQSYYRIHHKVRRHLCSSFVSRDFLKALE